MFNSATVMPCTSPRQPILGGRRYDNRGLRDQGRLLERRSRRCAAGKADHAHSLHSIIAAVADGSLSTEDAVGTIEEQCSTDALPDRQHRTEVVDADGMPTSQLAALLANLASHQHCAAARHVDSEVYATIRSMLPGVQYHGGARMLLYSDPNSVLPKGDKLPGHVAIVCGSGSDVQHAYEAKVALQLQGGYSTMMRDISPTNLAGLMSRKEQLQAADAVIVCCGEQPALAGLVLGLVDVPVVAIPGTGGRPDPNLAVSIQGACATAPGDGVGAANVAARTLHVAKQYIQHRKGREQSIAEEAVEECADAKHTPDEYMDRQPLPLAVPHNDSAFDSALLNGSATVSSNGAPVNGTHSNGNAVNGAHVNGTAVKGVR